MLLGEIFRMVSNVYHVLESWRKLHFSRKTQTPVFYALTFNIIWWHEYTPMRKNEPPLDRFVEGGGARKGLLAHSLYTIVTIIYM